LTCGCSRRQKESLQLGRAFVGMPRVGLKASAMSTNAVTGPANWKRSRYGFAAFFSLSLLVAWSALRLVLFLSFPPETPPPLADVLATFLIGLQRDGLVALLWTLSLLLWVLLSPQRRFASVGHRRFLFGVLLLFWLGQVFLLFTEFYFFEEFKSRFNTVAVDYLLYPHEVFINIWDSYPVPWVLLACAALAGGWV